MHYKIKETMIIREEELMNNNYSKNFSLYCKKIWNEYLKYSLENNQEYLNKKIQNNYLKEYYNLELGDYHLQKQKNPVNVINLLNNFEKFDNRIIINNLKKSINLEYFNEELEAYVEYLKNVRNNSIETIKDKKRGIKIFLKHLEENNIYSLENITKEIVVSFTDDYKNEILSKKIFFSFSLRSFLNYLFSENILKIDYSVYIPIIKRKCKKVYRGFEKEDIEKILNYANENKHLSITGYRNYAMILIAAKTGLRKIDILNLKYNSIDWDKKTINLIQIKTKKQLTVPFSDDVGNAIIDYINNERPFKLKKNDDYIFIRNSYPFNKLSCNYSLYAYLCNIFKECRIDINKYKKIGLHSFRFSIATEMLKNEVPLNIISSSLGHSSVNSTKVYLGVSIDKLKECFVEVQNDL